MATNKITERTQWSRSCDQAAFDKHTRDPSGQPLCQCRGSSAQECAHLKGPSFNKVRSNHTEPPRPQSLPTNITLPAFLWRPRLRHVKSINPRRETSRARSEPQTNESPAEGGRGMTHNLLPVRHGYQTALWASVSRAQIYFSHGHGGFVLFRRLCEVVPWPLWKGSCGEREIHSIL